MAALEKRIYDGNRAREALENEALVAAFEDIEKELKEAWKNSPARDEAGREKIYLMLHMLGKVQGALKISLETGMLASKELQHQRSLLDRAKGILQD